FPVPSGRNAFVPLDHVIRMPRTDVIEHLPPWCPATHPLEIPVVCAGGDFGVVNLIQAVSVADCRQVPDRFTHGHKRPASSRTVRWSRKWAPRAEVLRPVARISMQP